MTPQSFGKYQVTNRLGQGGMAAVYQALDPMLDRHVAIKVIHAHLAAEGSFAERFQQEARLVASLRHAHIVQLFDFDVIDDQHYMVMEFLDGGTLKDRILQLRTGRQTVPLGQVARLLDDLASALDYAHGRGAVHRDIKPANILFTAEREAVISDFGIAKILSETVQFSAAGAVIGTPAYMSPEQAGGERIDKRSDIYSLGVMIYEMAAGRVPYIGETPTSIIMQHLTSTPPPPRTFNPNVPEAIQRVILQALSRKREDRFSTAGEFAGAFRAALVGEATAASKIFTSNDDTQVDQTPFDATGSFVTGVALQGEETDVSDRVLGVRTPPGTEISVPETEPGPEQETEIDETPVREKPSPRKEIPVPKKKKQASQKNKQRWILGGLGLIAAVVAIGFVVVFGANWWADRQANEATELPQVTNIIPRFIIAVADFENSGASENIDFARRIFEGMETELAIFEDDVQIVRTNEIYADTDEAVAAMLENNAIMVVWGWYDDAGVSPFVELVDFVGASNPGDPILSTSLSENSGQSSPGLISLETFSQYVRGLKLGSRLDLFVGSGPEQVTYIAAASLALAYQLEGDLENALLLFNKAIENAPNISPGAGDTFGIEFVRFYRASVFHEIGEIENAIADLEESVSIAPDLSEAHFNLAVLYPQACTVEQPLEQASLAAETAVNLIPDDPTALGLLASLLAQMGDTTEAADVLEQTLSIDPENPAAHLLLGDVLEALGDNESASSSWENARALLEAEISESGPEVGTLFALGDALFRLGIYDLALENYQQVAEIDAENAGIFQATAAVYMAEEDFTRAREAYELWIDLEPASYQAHLQLGIAALREGDVSTALSSLSPASDLLPCDPTAEKMIGSLYWEQENYSKAAEAFNKAIQISPNDADSYYLLGATYLIDGRATEAISVLEQAVDLDPVSAISRNALATAYYEVGEFQGARDTWALLTEQHPGEAGFFTFLGNAYEKLEDYAGAIGAYEHSLDIMEDSNTRVFLAFIYQSQGELNLAKENLEIAVDNAPGDTLALTSLGDLYVQFGQRPQAAEMYERSLEIEENAFTRAQLGSVYAPMGRVDDAIAQYEQAVALNPDEPVFYGPLSILISSKGMIDEADGIYQNWLAFSPENPQPYAGLAQIGYKRCDIGAITEFYAVAFERAPDDPIYKSLYGYSFEIQGEFERVREIFSELETEAPNNFLTQILMGEHYLRGDQPEIALSKFENVSAFDTNIPFLRAIYLFDTGFAFELLGRDQEAQVTFETAALEYPAYVDAYVGLGDLALLAGNAEEAIGWYQEALLQLPIYAWEVSGDSGRLLAPAINIRLHIAYDQLGESENAGGSFDLAFAQMSNLLRETPDWPQVRLLNGFLHDITGDQRTALEEYQRASECDKSLIIAGIRLSAFAQNFQK